MRKNDLEFLKQKHIKDDIFGNILNGLKYHPKLKFYGMKDRIFFEDYYYLKGDDNSKYECMMISLFNHKDDNVIVYGEDAFNLNILVLLLMSYEYHKSFIEYSDLESFKYLKDLVSINDEQKKALSNRPHVRENVVYNNINIELLKLYTITEEHELKLDANKVVTKHIAKILEYGENYNLTKFQLQEYHNYWENDYVFILHNIMIEMGYAKANVGIEFAEDFNVNIAGAEFANKNELNHSTITLCFNYLKQIVIDLIGPIIDIENAYDVLILLERCFAFQRPGSVYVSGFKDNKTSTPVLDVIEELKEVFYDTTSTSTDINLMRIALTTKSSEGLVLNGDRMVRVNPFLELFIELLYMKSTQYLPTVKMNKSFDLRNEPSIKPASSHLDLYDLELTRYEQH